MKKEKTNLITSTGFSFKIQDSQGRISFDFNTWHLLIGVVLWFLIRWVINIFTA